MNKQNTHQERLNDLTECYNDENLLSFLTSNLPELNIHLIEKLYTYESYLSQIT